MHFFSINILENFLKVCNNLTKLADEPYSLKVSKKLRKSIFRNSHFNKKTLPSKLHLWALSYNNDMTFALVS